MRDDDNAIERERNIRVCVFACVCGKKRRRRDEREKRMIDEG